MGDPQEQPAPIMNDSYPVKCDRYYTENNKTHFIYGGYEGIPENLLVNFIAWVVLLTLFSLLRKIAWDYGRLALVNRTEARILINSESRYNVWTSLFYGDHTSTNEVHTSQESLDTQVHNQDKKRKMFGRFRSLSLVDDEGFCSWIPAFFKIKDENILHKCGQDAVQYLSFQRYLLIYMAIVTVLCIGIILPVNFQGDLEGTTQTFGHTTISNIDSNSPVLWVHTVLAVVILIIGIVFMRHFSVNLQYEEDEQATRTLMISNIPRDKCSRNMILQHFQEAYPEAPVEDIQFAYNISKLARLDKRRQRSLEGLRNSEIMYKQTGQRPQMVPYICGQCCCCQCCGCKEVDAIDYYAEEEIKHHLKCDHEKVNAFRSTLGIAFVTFDDDATAAKIHSDFKMSCKGAHNPMTSSLSRELNSHNWEVRYAPSSDNIYWENLSISPAEWWMKALCVNFLLGLLLFFLTTPSMFLNLLNVWGYQKVVQELSNSVHLHSPLLVQFVPTLLLWLVSSLLPNLVFYTDYYLIGHWTRTAEHHTVMRKTFIFLILMVLILPSLGLTSAKAFLEWVSTTRKDYQYRFRWTCVFIPDNGAFFVNYVVTSAFIGTAAELVRIPELFVYAMRLLCARSAAERTSVRKAVLWEFQFGVQYAWMLCVFSVTMAYSIPCPLITPFGLLYLLMKHMVDRYNIYFAFAPSKIDKNIHASAINFVIVSAICLQVSVLFFTILRADNLRSITIFAIVALFLTMVVFFGRICFGWFKGLSPIKYKVLESKLGSESGEVQPTTDYKPFIPTVLLEKQSTNEDTDDTNVQPSSQSYGAVDAPQASIHSNEVPTPAEYTEP